MSYRLAITGASGWLGRELISRLQIEFPEVELLALGQSSREIQIDGVPIYVHQWPSERLLEWEPDQIVHLAYRTREHYHATGQVEINADLTARFCDALRSSSVSSAVYVSSGAAVSPKFVGDSYGQQKFEDEVCTKAAATEAGVALVIARVWSVSGAQCLKPRRFLFHDLIRQALDPEIDTISLSSEYDVIRRYVDAGDFLLSCFRMAYGGKAMTVNSGGVLVSSRDLAERVRRLLAPSKTLSRKIAPIGVDLYAAEDDSIPWLSAECDTPFKSLDEQILHTAQLFHA